MAIPIVSYMYCCSDEPVNSTGTKKEKSSPKCRYSDELSGKIKYVLQSKSQLSKDILESESMGLDFNYD